MPSVAGAVAEFVAANPDDPSVVRYRKAMAEMLDAIDDATKRARLGIATLGKSWADVWWSHRDDEP
jgi:hypothetical protein